MLLRTMKEKGKEPKRDTANTKGFKIDNVHVGIVKVMRVLCI